MAQSDEAFTGSIPEVYDKYLVPLIFEDFANDLAARVLSTNPQDVLETAAGSGVVTRALAKVLPETTSSTVTDLNQPMLDRAMSQQAAPENFTWTAADALSLPFEDNSFDAVACQFGVMFFPDKLAGYKEAARVLRPGGTFLFNVWDDISENAFAQTVTQAAGELFPDNPPLFLARTPHGYNNTEEIRETLREAGFASVDATTRRIDSSAPSPNGPAIAYCQGTPLRNEILERDPDGLERVTKHATQRIEDVFGSGVVTGPIQGQVFTATL